jgi:hypothetical protein
LNIVSQTNVYCNGDSTGFVEINAIGGTAFTYNWSPSGGTTEIASGLTAGNYICQVTNNCGSTSNQLITITEPASIIDSISVNECDFYTLNGQTYNTSGTFLQEFTNISGCDSTLVINLVIDTMTITNNQNLLLTSSVANSYQWINCLTGSVILGETQQTFSVISNGSYAVTGLTNNGCTDTSACEIINNVFIDEIMNSKIVISPNPANDRIKIYFNSSEAEIIIFDNLGKKIFSDSIHTGEEVNIQSMILGVYIMEIHTQNGISYSRFIKE